MDKASNFKIVLEKGHYTAYADGEFFCTTDTFEEVEPRPIEPMQDTIQEELDVLQKLNTILNDVVVTMFGPENILESKEKDLRCMSDAIHIICNQTVSALSKAELIQSRL